MTRLLGRRVYLVPFSEQHLADSKYLSWVSDPNVMRYVGRDEYLRPIAFSEVRKYVERLWSAKGCTFLAIHHSAHDAFIGTVKIHFFDLEGQRRGVADIGIMIGNRDFRGKGLASDALHTACRYAFDELAARKLTAGAMAPNEPVIRAFKKIGFVEEGRLRNHLLVAGEQVDHVLLGCFEAELQRG